MDILVTICARGGSKGIPGKNIRLLNGKPLIAYSIAIAKKFSERFQGIVSLSTDDEEIRSIAKECGLNTDYIRPSELASDHSGKNDAIADLLHHEEKKRGLTFNYVLDLDVTSPLRTMEDLEKSYQDFKNDPKAVNLFSVNPANRNPYFNMVEEQPNGYYGLIKKGEFLTRQSAPPVYDMNASFEFFRRGFFSSGEKTSLTGASMIYVMSHICFDLDHPLDFDFMNYLMAHDKLGFTL